MLLDYPAGGVPHEAAAHGRRHAELEAGESDGGAAEAGGNEQGSRHRHALGPVPILQYNRIVMLIPRKTDKKPNSACFDCCSKIQTKTYFLLRFG